VVLVGDEEPRTGARRPHRATQPCHQRMLEILLVGLTTVPVSSYQEVGWVQLARDRVFCKKLCRERRPTEIWATKGAGARDQDCRSTNSKNYHPAKQGLAAWSFLVSATSATGERELS